MTSYGPQFVIDKKVLGTPQHLFVADGFCWVSTVPDGVWYMNGNLKDNSDWCLDTLLKLQGIIIDIKVPDRYYKAMESLMSGSISWPPPWREIMPKAAHRSFVESLIKSVAVSLNNAQKEYYHRVWVPGNHTFDKLNTAVVDKETFETLLESGEGNIGALRTFQPGADGLTQPIVYNRFGSRTGRPTVMSGPNILTLKREHRKLLRSRWGIDGSVVLLDFSALEVRVILYEAGHRCDNQDLYSDINESLFKSKLPRDVVKGAVISDLYGQSKRALGQRLGIKGKHLDAFMNKIRDYFKIEQLLKTIKQQFIENGYILNRYGRRVTIDEPLDHMLINSYAQSTGADVVTLGFNQIIKQLEGFRAVPIFFLVDAILLDVHNDDLDVVKSVNNITVDGYVQKWPLKFESVSQ